MRRTSFIVVITLVCLQLSCSSSSEAPSNSVAASGATSRPPEALRLERFKGQWTLGFTYRSSPDVAITVATVDVTQPTPDSVSFKSSVQLGSGPYDARSEEVAVTLKYNAAQKQYLLDANLLNGTSIKDLPLTYSDADGYAGQGKATGNKGEMNADVTIKNEKEEDHKWNITLSDKSRKEEYKFSFSSKSREEQAGQEGAVDEDCSQPRAA